MFGKPSFLKSLKKKLLQLCFKDIFEVNIMRGGLITDDITIIKCAYGRDWFYIYMGIFFYED